MKQENNKPLTLGLTGYRRVNIAELLKDAPKGAKLYSPICGECTFVEVDKDTEQIEVLANGIGLAFSLYGELVCLQTKDGECLLFPSKEVRDWSKFEVPKKEQPKFKFGDVVISGNAVYMVDDDYHNDSEHYITISCANAGAYHIATPDVIDGWNEMRLHPNHLHYSTSKRKIIHWFLPFDRVIVKDFKDGADCTRSPYPCWKAQIFSYYNKHDKEFPYVCLNDAYPVALPYNERTAKLIGTTDDYEEE